MNIKPAIKTYPAVFKTLEEAEAFRLMPNATLYAITKRFHMRKSGQNSPGGIYKTTYRIKYVEKHKELGVR